MAGLAALTVPELDALADEHGVADYPAEGKKDEKVAALEAAGVEPPGASFGFRLSEATLARLAEAREDARYVSFMAGGKAITLTADEPSFETRDPAVAAGLRSLDFLEEA